MSVTSHKNFMKRTSPIMGKVTLIPKYIFQEEFIMNKTTKTTIVGAIVGAIGVAFAVFAGNKAAKSDAIDDVVDEKFESLTTNEPTEDDIEGDIIEPEETTPAEEEKSIMRSA